MTDPSWSDLTIRQCIDLFRMVECVHETGHAPDCAAVLDDESDYEYLDDAGICTCGEENEPKL